MAHLLKPALIAATMFGAAPAHADLDVSSLIAENGIDRTIYLLEQMSRLHTPDEKFALAGLHFLAAIEAALHTRWQLGIRDDIISPPNPNPPPTDPAFVTDLFTNVSAEMDAARLALDQIPPQTEFSLVIDFADLWFDIDRNGARGIGEGLGEALGPIFLGATWDSRDPAIPLPVVRFDTADARWLMAYTHLVQGVSDTIIAYDPTAAIAQVRAARQEKDASPPIDDWIDFGSLGDFIDMITLALDQSPNAPRLAAAHAHFLQMIAENRQFWAEVSSETDNDREWLPHDNQQSALGIALPAGTGPLWLATLAEVEALLQGDTLLPHLTRDQVRGVNLRRMFLQPQPISLVDWVTQYGDLPYVEQGPIASLQNLTQFAQMNGDNAIRLALLLN